MKHFNVQTLAALAAIAALCALGVLGLCLSPSFAAMMPRGTDLGTTLSMVRTMTYPVCAIKCRLPPFGACACGSIDRLIAMF
jgi:hypothetical protein